MRDEDAILCEMIGCADSWEPSVTIIGNVRADEIAMVCRMALRRKLSEQPAQSGGVPPAQQSEGAPCSHKLVWREYIGQTPGRCATCGLIVP